MKREHDRRIDAVLHAIGEVQPQAGMDLRLLARLRDAEASGDLSSTGSWRQTGARSPWLRAHRLAVAAMLLVAFLLCVRPFAHRSSPHRERTSATSRSPGQQVVPVAGTKMAGAGANGGHHLGRAVAFATPRHQVLRASLNSPTSASLPPPPLPLTEQERLLLRLSRREPPRQLAQLTGAALDADFERGKAAVTAFFAPPETAETSVKDGEGHSNDLQTPALELP